MPDFWSLRLLAQEIAFKRAPGAETQAEPASWLGGIADLGTGGIIAATFAVLVLIRLLSGLLGPGRGGGFSVNGDCGDDGGGGD